MNELIKVYLDTDQPTILARDLYNGLSIQTKYTTWLERMAEFGFQEGKDFFPFLGKSIGGRPSKEHRITIEMAKHICMIQRSEIGKRYRQYFLELEKAWNSPEKVMARALQIARAQIEQLQTQCFQLTGQVKEQERELAVTKPKAAYLDRILHSKSLVLTTQIAKDYGMSAVKLNHLLMEMGIQYKVRNQWVLYSRYAGEGYTCSKTFEIPQSNGDILVKCQTEWTQKGRLFLYDVLKANGIVPVVERRTQEVLADAEACKVTGGTAHLPEYSYHLEGSCGESEVSKYAGRSE